MNKSNINTESPIQIFKINILLNLYQIVIHTLLALVKLPAEITYKCPGEKVANTFEAVLLEFTQH